jgi:hypothetical protein
MKPMKFRVFKCSIDGICGGEEEMPLERVLSEVSYSRGWTSTTEMHESIKKWAKSAKPGSYFKTNASAIIAVKR